MLPITEIMDQIGKKAVWQIQKDFTEWWAADGYKFKPETDEESEWLVQVRYWAWRAYLQAHVPKK